MNRRSYEEQNISDYVPVSLLNPDYKDQLLDWVSPVDLSYNEPNGEESCARIHIDIIRFWLDHHYVNPLDQELTFF